MKLRYLFIALLGMFAFTACEHPDNSEEVPYYWTENVCYLDATSVSQSIMHSPLGLVGVEDGTTYTVKVRLKKATDKDVTCYFDLSSDNEILPESSLYLSASTVVIPAGETEKEVEVGIADYSPLASIKDAVSANVTLTLVEVENAYCAEVRNSFSISVSKSAYSRVVYGSIDEGSELDRSGWTVTNLNNGSTTSKLTDGDYYSYLYTEPVYISIDFGAMHKVTGFENTCYPYSSDYYTFRTMEFSYSQDGETWEDLGSVTGLPAAYYQDFYFPGGYSCRYLRVKMYDGMDDGWGVSTEIFVWAND
ncbi:MAG: discoidin domain-containing protein [Bacteroidales bacterium]|nr:discoidin domain-containing protein [Bacteroidales bacterium]